MVCSILARFMPEAMSKSPAHDICLVGGAGHVGAPLSVVLACRGFRTLIYDVNDAAVRSILAGCFPFVEERGEATLHEALASGRLSGSSRREDVTEAENLVLTIGTPIDEFQNPVWQAVTKCVADLLPYLGNTRLVVLRSTVSPGTTDR